MNVTPDEHIDDYDYDESEHDSNEISVIEPARTPSEVETPPAEQTQNSSSKLVNENEHTHGKLINEIINKHFEITQVKLSRDDPLIGLLLAQKLDLESQLSHLKESIKKGITEATVKESNERLTEVDKRFQVAQNLADELEAQRHKILTELGNIHQKNLITYAAEQSKKIDELKAWIGLTKVGLAITTLTFFIVLISNIK